MRFDHVQLYAENAAEALIESVRKEILSHIASGDLKGFQGKQLRDQIAIRVKQAMRNRSFTNYLDNAFASGMSRAGRQVRHIKTPRSTIPKNISLFEEAMNSGLKKLEGSIIADTQILLARASNGSYDKDTVFRKLGDSSKGMFRDYTERARGILFHETDVAEAQGFASRMKEIAIYRTDVNKDDISKRAKKNISQGKKPFVMKMWRHSGLGNPPRENHIEMDGKAVPVDMQFQLVSPDGEIYNCDNPKAAGLPISETAWCRCATIPKVIFATDEEIKDIRSMAEDTGGYRDPRWTKVS